MTTRDEEKFNDLIPEIIEKLRKLRGVCEARVANTRDWTPEHRNACREVLTELSDFMHTCLSARDEMQP